MSFYFKTHAQAFESPGQAFERFSKTFEGLKKDKKLCRVIKKLDLAFVL